jgi:hypothetical protein
MGEGNYELLMKYGLGAQKMGVEKVCFGSDDRMRLNQGRRDIVSGNSDEVRGDGAVSPAGRVK